MHQLILPIFIVVPVEIFSKYSSYPQLGIIFLHIIPRDIMSNAIPNLVFNSVTIFLHVIPRKNMKKIDLLTSIGWSEKLNE